MYNTLRNIILSVCIGSIVAIAINMKAGPNYKRVTGEKVTLQEYKSAEAGIVPVFNRTALAMGFFVFSALFMIKPLREKTV